METEKELELTEEIQEQTQTPETQDIPVEEAVVEEAPVEETPAEEAPAEETPAEEAPAEEAPVEEAPVEVPSVPEKPKKVKKIRRRPWPLKILLGLVAFVLCIAMFAVTLAGALVVDLRVMTSEGGIKEILTELIMPSKPTASNRLSAGMTLTAASPIPGTGTDTSGDMSNFLLDTAFDILQQQFGEDITINKEQVSQFLDQSTAKDFLADKVSGMVDDFINETNNTTITRDEIMNLVTENKQLIEETFDVTIDDEMIGQMEAALEDVEIFDAFEEKGLMGVVTEGLAGGNTGSEPEVGPDGEPVAPGVPGMSGGSNSMQKDLQTIKEVMAIIRMVISDNTLFAAIGAFVALFLLVFLVNFSLPKTLSDTGIVLTFAGLILSAPNFLYMSGLLHTILPAEMSGVLALAGGLLNAVQSVHFAILGAGVALIVLAIVAKIFKTKREQKLLAQCA